ncbi:hypothetical protein NHX12_013946 [Muraenolepis orangiensis]|uniref:Uncharacterized protein n=1 Tax=Muraenolepis orangiensis TaxID=630683 RepID=A0A9Q0DB16_9TELE|nr:hypothetical protein NHX12_013946 [Muraenolepis orangiensis]
MEEEQVPPAVESGESPTAIPNPEVFASEGYATEAMAADLEPWIVFDCGKTPRAEFDDWLESNRPSQVSRYGEEDKGPVGWIAVRRADHSDPDHAGLQESWDKLLASGRTVNYQAVKELALNHRVLSGKWLMHLDTGFKLEHAWECVARAVLDGKILQVKVSTRDPASQKKQVICCGWTPPFAPRASSAGWRTSPTCTPTWGSTGTTTGSSAPPSTTAITNLEVT